MDPLPFWQILVLAVIQGVTEFLPISSDGHLCVANALMNHGAEEAPKIHDLTIVLHMGTLGSILCFYWSRVWRLLGSDRWVLWTMVLGTIPAVVLGVPAKLWGDAILESVLLAGLMLPVSGLALLWASRVKPGNVEYPQITLWQTFWIGIAQALAILPGLSRSGSTIATGLQMGLTRSSSAAYSFLLAIPVLAGAGVWEALKMARHHESLTTPPLHLAVGTFVSFVVGIGALYLVNRWLEQGRLHLFAWYCIILGAAVTIWQVVKML